MKRRLFTALAFALTMTSAAMAPGADAPQLPNPLRHVAAGQWVRYRLNMLFGAAEQRHTVIAVTGEGDDALITIRTETTMDDEVVDEREENTTYRKLLNDQAEALDSVENPTVSMSAAEFAGTSLDAVAVRYTQEGENFTLLLSEDIPLFGVIRLEQEGAEEPVMELIDYGG